MKAYIMERIRKDLLLIMGSVAGVLAGHEAKAENREAYPKFYTGILIELQNELGVDATDPGEERNHLFFRTEIESAVGMTEHVGLGSVLVIEPVRDPLQPGRDVFFEKQGIFIEELHAHFEWGKWALTGGKFNPEFGKAWEEGRGIFGEDFAEDYEIAEKIGLSGSYAVETSDAGTHRLTVSTFFADTTFLSDSVITGRGKLSRSDGGASNTGDFSSLAIGLDGADFNAPGLERFYYKLGYRHLGKAGPTGRDERGWSGTLGYATPLTDRLQADLLIEFADIDQFEGEGEDREYFTASLATILDEVWNLTVSTTLRERKISRQEQFDDTLFQASFGYNFQNGLTLEAGWKATEVEGNSLDIFGILARYSHEF